MQLNEVNKRKTAQFIDAALLKNIKKETEYGENTRKIQIW